MSYDSDNYIARCQEFSDSLTGISTEHLLGMLEVVLRNDPHAMRFAEVEVLRAKILERTR